jgi:hypothetical protein
MNIEETSNNDTLQSDIVCGGFEFKTPVIVIFYDEPILLSKLKKMTIEEYGDDRKLLFIQKNYLPPQITVEKYPTIRFYKSSGFPNTTDYIEFN